MYDKEQVRRLFAEGLGRGKLIVVSNREPFVHERCGDQLVCKQPAGGLTAALNPLLGAAGGIWVAHGSGSGDNAVVDARDRVAVPPENPSYLLRRVWIPERQHGEYYNGLANRGLWPLCHHVFQRPRFRAAEWASYRDVNQLFAQAVLEEAAGRAGVVFIQDYHLALLGGILKKHNPLLTVAHFWHIPWPSPDTFSAFPWKEELLEGMLGGDLVGFHLREHCANFMETVERTLGARVFKQHGSIIREGKITSVRHFPIGIDTQGHADIAASSGVRAATVQWKARIGPNRRVGIGIDRIDYTKGIAERIRALGILFEENPEWREKLVFIQVGVPSRCEIPEYQVLSDEIDCAIASVNSRWGTESWQPIVFVKRNLPAEEMIALHKLADFCLVTSLHDGMNLVAKEFVASRSDLDGVLVLSRFAGASEELNSALLINPFSEDEIAQAVLAALTMPAAERNRRMSRMRVAVEQNNIYHWASDILSALIQIEAGSLRMPAVPLERLVGAGRIAEASFA